MCCPSSVSHHETGVSKGRQRHLRWSFGRGPLRPFRQGQPTDRRDTQSLTWPTASFAHFAIFDIPGAFEDTSFASLAELVSESTLKGVQEMGFEHMTEIQHKSIRPLLEGRSVPPLDVTLFQGVDQLFDRLTVCVCLQGCSGCCKDRQW